MKNSSFLFIFVLSLFVFSSQVLSQDYWQQEVNYEISVRLDDERHMLHAFETFEYINHSPDTLDELYIHLWPNAYKNEKSALAQQMLEDGDEGLLNVSNEDCGFIDSLAFQINGTKVNYKIFNGHQDIVVLALVKPLLPGESIQVATPFRVKVPSGSISRLGHIGQSYQITQWYPKPAVYDKNGWNPMPYLNQGEFYSEFGSFDVSITIPENYVLGSTGDLQNASEIKFMNDLAQKTGADLNSLVAKSNKGRVNTPFPPSSDKYKTIRYTQDRVHDFAWFADKRYAVLKGTVELPGTRKLVDTWALFVPQNAKYWQHAVEYLNDGTYYYSLWNGNYPYSHVTAVDGTISAGGGMEYPNVTVIGNSSSKEELEIVIVHEVGHNWFYGIIGSNERVHGWMDEGINTLNEVRYIQTKYPGNTRLSDMVLNGRFHLNDLDYHDMADLIYRFIHTAGADQPIETHSAEFSSANYGIVMYQKTGLVFYYLKDYLGDLEFDRIMHVYFDQWKFKHPQPEDLRMLFEQETGKDLSWFFDDLIQTTNHVDYKIRGVKPQLKNGSLVKVKNTGQVNGPIEINAFNNDSLVESIWIEPGQTDVLLNSNLTDFNRVVIDANKNIPELSRHNNTWRKKALFHKWEPLKLEFFSGDHEPNRTNMFWTPTAAGNAYDGLMLGTAFHNLGIPLQRFQYLVAPQFGLKSKNLVGIAEALYVVLPKKNVKQLKIGASLKSFTHRGQFPSRFFGITPYLKVIFGDRSKKNTFFSYAEIKGVWQGDFSQNLALYQNNYGFRAKYLFQKEFKKTSFVISPSVTYYEQSTENEEGLDIDRMLRAELKTSFNVKYQLGDMKRYLRFNAYIGKNVVSELTTFDSYHQNLSMTGVEGGRDLFLEQYYFNRGGVQQQMDGMGNFYSTSSLGTNSDWVASFNTYLAIPLKPNLFGLFYNQGLFPGFEKIEYVSNAGLAIRIGDVFGVYFPLLRSQNMGSLFEGSYTDQIRFTLQFNIVENGFNIGSFIN
ncbi:MAG: M1 family metallopeptidase [Crocinitomicaceae bacterium]|nr:M1 family metallopeptidase [Crocinitomicaceae bacterium]